MDFVRRCGLGTVTCEEAETASRPELAAVEALIAPAFFLGHFVSLGLFEPFI